MARLWHGFHRSSPSFSSGRALTNAPSIIGGESADKDLTGFKAASWGLDVSHVEVVQLSLAIAAFENEHPLMEIDSLQIQASKDNVQYQTARLNVSTIIKQ